MCCAAFAFINCKSFNKKPSSLIFRLSSAVDWSKPRTKTVRMTSMAADSTLGSLPWLPQLA